MSGSMRRVVARIGSLSNLVWYGGPMRLWTVAMLGREEGFVL